MTDLTEMDALALLDGIRTDKFSCQEVMVQTLSRIEAVNPAVNAIISLRSREDLMEEASQADLATTRGPLHGLPIAIKDLAEVRGLRSTHGSPIFADLVPKADHLIVARIRAAGAIIIGKTNTPEFGLGSQSYNPVHGTTRTPYDVSKTSGGSSGGAAAALGARMVSLADGSDMMGSLRNPAAFCNVYGFRPSYGLVPLNPTKETFLHQLATEGPMARTIADMALLLDVIGCPDPRHPHSMPKQPSFLEALNVPIEDCRLGWLGDWNGAYPMETGILDLCQAAFESLKKSGHTIDDLVPEFSTEALWDSWVKLRSFAVAAGLEEHYRNPAQRKLLKPEAIYEIEQGLALTSSEIAAASKIRSQWFVETARLFETFDALILPTAQVFPFDAEVHWPKQVNGTDMKTYHNWMEIVVPASLIGLPALNVPVGFSQDGLPMGMQIIGPRGSDAKLLRLGEAYHRATGWPQARPPVLT